MDKKNKKTLAVICKELATASKWQPSHTCKQCRLFAKKLTLIAELHLDILKSVRRKEIRQSYAKEITVILIEVVKSFFIAS